MRTLARGAAAAEVFNCTSKASTQAEELKVPRETSTPDGVGASTFFTGFTRLLLKGSCL